MMPIDVPEGAISTIYARVVNTSTRAGDAIEAVLTVGFDAEYDGILLPEKVVTELFSPGEERIIDYPVDIPFGAGGKQGSITVSVRDPADNILAPFSDSLNIRLVPFPNGVQSWSVAIYDEPFPITISLFAYDWSLSIGLSQGAGLWSFPIYQWGTYSLDLTTGELILLSPGGSSVQLMGTGFRPGATDWFLYSYDGVWHDLGGFRNVASSFTVPALSVNLQSALDEAISFIQANTPLAILSQQVSVGASVLRVTEEDRARLWPQDVNWSLIPASQFTFAFWVAPPEGVMNAGRAWRGVKKHDGINDTVYISIPVAGGWKDTGLWWAGGPVDDWNLRLAQIILHEWAHGMKDWLALVGFDIQTLYEDLGFESESKVNWINHFFPQITPEMWELITGG